MRETIILKSKNIGSLSSFIKNNEEYLIEINNNIPKEVLNKSISEKVYYYINKISEPLLCICDNPLSYIGFKNGYRKSCGSKDCYVKMRKETCLEKYGVDNPKKSKDIIEKEQLNIKRKWNGKHFMSDKDVQDKFNNTMMNLYNVKWSQQSNVLKEKSITTWDSNENKYLIIKNRTDKFLNKSDEEKELIELKRKNSIIEKYGSYDNFVNFRLDKIKESSIRKYGLDHHFKSTDIQLKRIESYKTNITNKIFNNLPEHIIFNYKKLNENKTDSILNLSCKICDNCFDINRQLFINRINNKSDVCLKCNPISSGTSLLEKELLEYIRENYNGIIIENYKNKLEIDIYLPELKIGFEFNGLYWHSELYKDKNYHLNKSDYFSNIDIQIVHIWENDWIFKKDIVKSLITKLISNKIYLDKYEIKEVDDFVSEKFLNDNHLDGYIKSEYNIGLYHENELLSLMTFNNNELLRYCSIRNIDDSKILKYVINNYKFDKIISNINRDYFKIYSDLGFFLESKTEPNIKYFEEYKIFDSGNFMISYYICI
jgi:hypothetical protein